MAELIVALRSETDRETTSPATLKQIDRLNRDFGNLHEVIQNADDNLSEALIEPVLNRFAGTLATAALARPELAGRCESLAEELRKLLDPPSQEVTGDSNDLDIPY